MIKLRFRHGIATKRIDAPRAVHSLLSPSGRYSKTDIGFLSPPYPSKVSRVAFYNRLNLTFGCSFTSLLTLYTKCIYFLYHCAKKVFQSQESSLSGVIVPKIILSIRCCGIYRFREFYRGLFETISWYSSQLRGAQTATAFVTDLLCLVQTDTTGNCEQRLPSIWPRR